MTDIIKIDFAGGVMEATLGPDGGPFVNVKRVCQELGINANTQYKKLKSKPWATVVIITTVGSDGKEREMLGLNAQAVPMWAATINASKIKPGLRPRLEAYQMEAADVLTRHFMPGTEIAVSQGGGNLARLISIQEMASAALKIGEGLTKVAIDHEQRLRVLEAKPAVTIKKTGAGERRQLLTRWIARFREETGPMTEGMEQGEKSKFFSEVNGRLKGVFGDKKNWHQAKFYEAARWLHKNYGIDITDIEE